MNALLSILRWPYIAVNVAVSTYAIVLILAMAWSAWAYRGDGVQL